MKWDVKIALYSFLVYAFYGVSYLLSNGDFVVPYPVLIFALPIIGLIYLFSTKFNKYSIFYFIIPLGVLSEWGYLISRNLGDLFSLLSVAGYIALGILILFDKKVKEANVKRGKTQILGVILTLGAILLFANFWVTISYVGILAILGIIVVREDDDSIFLTASLRRLIIFLSLNAWCFIATWLSFVLN